MDFREITNSESTAKRAVETADKWVYHDCPEEMSHRQTCVKWTAELPNRPVDDVIWTWESTCLITERVVKIFREAGLTGYELKPATVRFKKQPDKKAPKVWELVVTGWGGMAPPESGIRLVESRHCEGCGRLKLRYKGPCDPTLLIDESQWDGSDFFFVWPFPKFRFVNERVAALVRSEKITGVVLKPPEDLENLDGAIVGSLSRRFPDARAKEIGEPLGIY